MIESTRNLGSMIFLVFFSQKNVVLATLDGAMMKDSED